MTCELCQRYSGRFNANLRCCQIRMLAGLPKERRQLYYEKVRTEQGEEAVRKLIAEVKTEYQRTISTQHNNNQGLKK